MSASLTQGCAHSTELLPPQMATVPARLLADPAQLPLLPRTTDPATGKLSLNGEQCLTGGVEVYDVAGAIRAQLVDLIAADKAKDAAPVPKKRRKLF
jgi:hypothetical protein